MLDVLISKPENKTAAQRAIEVSNRTDKPIKSFLKAISWRVVGTIDTMVISYFITGHLTMAISIGSAEVITKTVLYYFHERLWARIHRLKINLPVSQKNKPYGIEPIEQ
ncbi:DUF2061 domain-containing protein [bacterium]|jgi:uncharacterized membrane protein|nr:DUF2061 domain-containing protein [bacterium]